MTERHFLLGTVSSVSEWVFVVTVLFASGNRGILPKIYQICEIWGCQKGVTEDFYFQCHHMSFVDFVVLPPGHGRSVTDFWRWEAHEAQLRCPDDLWVVIDEDVAPGGALSLNSTNLPRPWSPWESSPSSKIPTVEPGIEPGTSWLVIRGSEH